MKKGKFVFERHFGRQGIAQIVADALSHLAAAKYPSLNGTSCIAQCEWTKSGDGIRVSVIFDHVPAADTPIFDDEPFILYNEEYDQHTDGNLIN